MMGGDNQQAATDEYPKHKVTVNGFWMDATTVTNAQFAKFVKATGYITTAGAMRMFPVGTFFPCPPLGVVV